MKRLEISLAAGLILAVFIGSFTSFARDTGEIRADVMRLHILANSDSAADQLLKLQVRDRVLSGFSGGATKAEATQKLKLAQIEAAAEEEILRRGYSYHVKAGLVNMYFESRAYNGVTLPAGRYDAVRVEIGEAKGQNWWCVMFPPMCIPAAAEKPEEPLPVEERLK